MERSNSVTRIQEQKDTLTLATPWRSSTLCKADLATCNNSLLKARQRLKNSKPAKRFIEKAAISFLDQLVDTFKQTASSIPTMIDNQPSFVVIGNRCVSYSYVSAQSVCLFVLILVVSIVGASAEPEPHPRKGLFDRNWVPPLFALGSAGTEHGEARALHSITSSSCETSLEDRDPRRRTISWQSIPPFVQEHTNKKE